MQTSEPVAIETNNTQQIAPRLEDLPKDLQAHVHTIRAITVAHNLIAESTYPCSKFVMVQETIGFLRSIRDRSIEMAASLDGADKVPELKEYIDRTSEQNRANAEKAEQDGKDGPHGTA